MKEKPIQVLLLEDEQENTELVEQMLADIKDRQVQIASAATLSGALELMKQLHFDAIIADLGLPDSAGLETFAALHARDPKVPVIILTCINDAALAVEAVRQGAQDYLIKSELSRNVLIRTLFYAMERNRINKEREGLVQELKDALSRVKTLTGLLPICANCKKIRNDKGYWEQVETYLNAHADVRFSHSICPDCMTECYPGVCKKKA